MSIDFVAPTLLLVAVASATGWFRWPLGSRLLFKGFTVVAVVAAASVLSVTAVTGGGYALGPGRRTALVEWCRVIPLGHEVGSIEGVGALFALAAMAVRVAIVVVRRWNARVDTMGRRIAIVDTKKPLAYAAPGNPGCVVVSTGMLSGLEPRERQVVFAHERAHLRQSHHRFLLLGALAQAVVPTLSPLVCRLRLGTELSADQEAVLALGGDRQLVASTIAKAAIMTSTSSSLVPAIDGGSVVARVEALVGSTPSRSSVIVGLASAFASMAVAVVAATVQAHHLWELLDHICHT